VFCTRDIVVINSCPLTYGVVPTHKASAVGVVCLSTHTHSKRKTGGKLAASHPTTLLLGKVSEAWVDWNYFASLLGFMNVMSKNNSQRPSGKADQPAITSDFTCSDLLLSLRSTACAWWSRDLAKQGETERGGGKRREYVKTRRRWEGEGLAS
jgi:hypothetical protein